MNDLLNDITKQKNIEELYQNILLIVTLVYNKNRSESVRKRKINMLYSMPGMNLMKEAI